MNCNSETCVIIPTFNEERGIEDTLNSIPDQYDVFIVDNFSEDKTVQIAEEAGAKVLLCKKGGKGNAVKFAFENLGSHSNYVLIDGDSTYDGKYITYLIKELRKGKGLVIGSRFRGKCENISLFRRLSNGILNYTLNLFHGKNITDISSGLRAINKNFLKEIKLESEGFEIETEITYKAISKGFDVSEVPIGYNERKGESKLTLLDMIKIYLFVLKAIFSNKAD